MIAADFTEEQLETVVTIERICSSISLVGCFLIIASFLYGRAFQDKPINRLVFYASLGNVMTNIATLIARSALHNKNGGLCQFQAFLIQMFLPADAYWTCAMACNVMVTFFWYANADFLRRLEKWYMLVCYGAPFVPAFVYIFAETKSKGRMYGNATLWCWITSEWDGWRIYTFYAPVWIVIGATLLIYALTGRRIYRKRKELRNFRIPAPNPIPIMRDPFTSVKTTEVFVTSEKIDGSSDSVPPASQDGPKVQHQGNGNFVEISTSTLPRRMSSTYVPDHPPPSRNNADIELAQTESASYPASYPLVSPIQRHQIFPVRRFASQEANNAAWSYTKVALLFFCAMMVTWIPSSANRFYSYARPTEVNLALEYMSAFVLPLQGFWNAIIYFSTSSKAVRLTWNQFRNREHLNRPGSTPMMSAANSAFAYAERFSAQGASQRLPSRDVPQFGVAGRLQLNTEGMHELADRTPVRPISIQTKDSAS